MSLFYDRQGRPIDDVLTWGRLFETSDRCVGDTRVGGVRVSTVWLGIDHSWGPGPPLIFETMIFGGPDDQAQERYATEAEAALGHEYWVRRQRRQQRPRLWLAVVVCLVWAILIGVWSALLGLAWWVSAPVAFVSGMAIGWSVTRWLLCRRR